MPIAIVAGSSAPILALVLAIAAPNKVAGFAVVKVMNAVNLLPVVAYSVSRALQFVAGIFPTYWPMRALWSAATGESYVEHLVIGAVISAFALLLAVWCSTGSCCDTGDSSLAFRQWCRACRSELSASC